MLRTLALHPSPGKACQHLLSLFPFPFSNPGHRKHIAGWRNHGPGSESNYKRPFQPWPWEGLVEDQKLIQVLVPNPSWDGEPKVSRWGPVGSEQGWRGDTSQARLGPVDCLLLREGKLGSPWSMSPPLQVCGSLGATQLQTQHLMSLHLDCWARDLGFSARAARSCPSALTGPQWGTFTAPLSTRTQWAWISQEAAS